MRAVKLSHAAIMIVNSIEILPPLLGLRDSSGGLLFETETPPTDRTVTCNSVVVFFHR